MKQDQCRGSAYQCGGVVWFVHMLLTNLKKSSKGTISKQTSHFGVAVASGGAIALGIIQICNGTFELFYQHLNLKTSANFEKSLLERMVEKFQEQVLLLLAYAQGQILHFK